MQATQAATFDTPLVRVRSVAQSLRCGGVKTWFPTRRAIDLKKPGSDSSPGEHFIALMKRGFSGGSSRPAEKRNGHCSR
jgi:hypothetical protein